MIRQTSIASRMPNGSANPIFAAAGGVLNATLVAGPMKAMASTAAPRPPMAPPRSLPPWAWSLAGGEVPMLWLIVFPYLPFRNLGGAVLGPGGAGGSQGSSWCRCDLPGGAAAIGVPGVRRALARARAGHRRPIRRGHAGFRPERP